MTVRRATKPPRPTRATRPRPRWAVAAAIAGLATSAVAAWAYRDYRRWRALGVGGLPPNLRGWLRVTSMRLQAGDPFAVQSGHPAHPQLENLPERSGPRPKVAPHPVPHRVLDQHSPHELIDQLAAMFDEFAAMKSPALEYRTSGWEKHNKALFASTPATPHDPAQPTSGELGHFHPSDGSLHVILSPGDAYLVISNQWGELHPLAGRSLNLPPTYTLLYPARNQNELATIRTIVTAAIDNMTGT